MNALDPVVSARPAYLPTGPRGDYRPEHLPYRRDEGLRGAYAQGGVPSAPPRPAKIAAAPDRSDGLRAESLEPLPVPPGAPSVTQEVIVMQPTTTSTSNSALTHLPMTAPAADDEESPQETGEATPLSASTKKERIAEAVRRGQATYAEISSVTGLSKSEVSAIINATLLATRRTRPAVLVEISPPGAKERRFEIANEDAREPHLQKAIHLPDGGAAPASLCAATTGATPFRFRFHVGGLGHTMMAGPIESGTSMPRNKAARGQTGMPLIFTEGTQKDRVLAALRHGARTTTEIALRTRLPRNQIHKVVSWLVKRGELRDLPSENERAVEFTPPTTPSPVPGAPSRRTLEAGDTPRSPPSLVTSAAASPGAAPLKDAQLPRIRNHEEPMPSMGENVDLLQEAALDALGKLRDAISQLADLARENAAAGDRLAAVQKLLGGEG